MLPAFWELLLKKNKKDARSQDPLAWWERYIIQMDIPTLAIRTAHVVALGHLPDWHKDPFDRILVAQAIVEGMPLISKDNQLQQYGVAIVW